VHGSRGKHRSRGAQCVPGFVTLRAPGGIEEDEADGPGRWRKARGLLSGFVPKYLILCGKGNGAYGNALCPASSDKDQGRREDEGVRRVPPSLS
jgi:hypothetical protein